MFPRSLVAALAAPPWAVCSPTPTTTSCSSRGSPHRWFRSGSGWDCPDPAVPRAGPGRQRRRARPFRKAARGSRGPGRLHHP